MNTRLNPFFALLSFAALLSGCATSTITVLEKKETPKPFSKIMTVYIDNDIDFAVFDSLTYDICVRPAFMDTASLQTRGDMEGLLCDKLSSPRSSVFRSSDLFGLDFNSYKDFIAEMDSMSADALLLVHIHHYTYSNHELSAPIDPRTGLSTGPSGSYRTPNAAFACYLIRPHEYLPLWRAEISVKGQGYVNGRHVLKTDMIAKLENSLVTGGYIAPPR